MTRKVAERDRASVAVGLRERKRQRTQATIQAAGLHLFATQGYDATTCEQIAAAAEVSPATFFRYFPTKEDVVLFDDYDVFMRALLHNRPPGESPVVAVRRSLAAAFGAWSSADIETIRTRLRLVLSVPALRARREDKFQSREAMLVGELAQRMGVGPEALEVRVVARAIRSTAALA
ncbi:MAG TPA: TetR family transcriptional regulator, partial [Acidimicrobiia bacterium]|nr:TetR family transcriptional regulator [Acidimicrobiia bacterium]